MFLAAPYVWLVILAIVLGLVVKSIRILRQYERAVVFTLGKFQGVKGPGLVILIPFVQEMVRVDLRIQVIEVPSQDVISRDNVSMKVDAVLYFRVVDPERAVIQVQNYLPATNMLAQTTLRAVLGQHELDEMLSERKKCMRRPGPIDLSLARCRDVMERRAGGSSSGTTRRGPYVLLTCCA
jgi:regulator of protease activity HflC (stomatin/prohibitin superfamily)